MTNEDNCPEEFRDQSSQEDPDSPDENLLDEYLAMPKKERDMQFVDTASAAEIANVSQRTIELWIAGGTVRAVLVARRYQVSLPSLIAYLKSRSRKADRTASNRK